jgi:GT2 family glycosyltransferase
MSMADPAAGMRASGERGLGTIRVAVVVVGTNERRWLERCLHSVGASRTDDFALSVFYVDNASTDGSTEYVACRFPTVTIIRNPRNLGFAAANNVGIRAAVAGGARYVVLLNPDTQTPPDMVGRLLTFMESAPSYAIIGPLQYEYGGPPSRLGDLNRWSVAAFTAGERSMWADEITLRPSALNDPEGRRPHTLEHAYVAASCLLVRASVLERIGLFNETYETYFEDVDLCRRARWAGWRVAVVTSVGVQHFCGGGGGTPEQELYRRIRIRRNRYYHLFTGPDWSLGDAVRLASRWLARDVIGGQHIGFAIGRVRAAVETAAAIGWLLTRLPCLARARRQHHHLVAARSSGRQS